MTKDEQGSITGLQFEAHKQSLLGLMRAQDRVNSSDSDNCHIY